MPCGQLWLLASKDMKIQVTHPPETNPLVLQKLWGNTSAPGTAGVLQEAPPCVYHTSTTKWKLLIHQKRSLTTYQTTTEDHSIKTA